MHPIKTWAAIFLNNKNSGFSPNR